MAIPDEKFEEIRKYLEKSENPLIMFDDDPDGLCSFLTMNKLCDRGKHVVIKASPKLDVQYLNKITEYGPDLVVVLDKPIVSQEFIDNIQVPILWIDHHPVLKRKGIHYYNPRINDEKDNRPTTYWCYKIVNKENALWIATIGCISDWHIPDFIKEFTEKYPDIITNGIKQPEDILFKTKLGLLSRVFSFILKGDLSDVKKCINVLTKIESPYEILNQETPKGKFIYKRYEVINKEYQKLLSKALKSVTKEKLAVFTYKDAKISFTSDLSNELIYKYPEKVILIGREKSGEMKMSLRSKEIILPRLIEKALVGIKGYGGGHDFAIGSSVKIEDFERFIENLNKLLKTKD